jgi:hypothetical protein
MQVVVFGAHDAPRERLALSYTSRRDHLGAECLPLHPRWQRASGERALQGAELGDRSWDWSYNSAKLRKPPTRGRSLSQGSG